VSTTILLPTCGLYEDEVFEGSQGSDDRLNIYCIPGLVRATRCEHPPSLIVLAVVVLAHEH